MVIFFSQFESMPFGHSTAIFALGSRLHFWFSRIVNPQKFNLSVLSAHSTNCCGPPIAVVQVQDHRPQRQNSPAALRNDHSRTRILWRSPQRENQNKPSSSPSSSVKGFWFCWTPPHPSSRATTHILSILIEHSSMGGDNRMPNALATCLSHLIGDMQYLLESLQPFLQKAIVSVSAFHSSIMASLAQPAQATFQWHVILSFHVELLYSLQT